MYDKEKDRPEGEPDPRIELYRLEEAVDRLLEILQPRSPTRPSTPTPKQLRMLIKARRTREQMLGADLFADPAWDILLEAYLATLTETKMSVTALCHSAAVPPSTALRWIQKLEQDEWLVRKDDPSDARRAWIELTAQGYHRMSRYFSAVSPGVFPV